MKTVLLCTLLVAASFAFSSEKEYQDAFVSFMQKYQKSYNHEEFQTRYNIFKTNINYIHSFNAENNGVTLAMNHFGDLTNQEFRGIYNGFKMPAKIEGPIFNEVVAAPPAHFDWNDHGAVTPIKNQQQCGSCWSFSTTGSTEGCHAIKTGKLVSLSEQNLIDCSTSYGDQGCDGGLMTDAMTYIIANHGIDTEASYPYQAADGTCNFKTANIGATLASFTNVPSGDEKSLLCAAVKGPVSVAIDASQNSFQFYSSGVYSDPNCSSQNLDHGVLVVGWGHDDSSNQDYWIVKNSWGTTWGLNGFIWMARNDNNMCGIATMATLPAC